MIIEQQLVQSSTKTYKGTNGRKFVTVHMTGNLNIGANAQAHANLQSRGNVRNASWHWSVDDHEAIQSFLNTVRCWHAGDGEGDGNLNSIAIEICVNSDGDLAQAVINASKLVAKLMADEDIPLRNVVQHNRWSSYGKNCPAQLRAGMPYNWSQFLGFVAGEVEPSHTPAPKPTPTTPSTGGFDMASIPMIDLNTTTSQWNPMVERIQALVKYAGDIDPGPIDGRNGTLTKKGAAAFQKKYNSGDGKGNADLYFGDRSWESALTGKKW